MSEYPPGPFSLDQAEMINSRSRCPYCGWKRGEMHPVLQKPMCADQILAGEVIKWHRNKAQDLRFRTGQELVQA